MSERPGGGDFRGGLGEDVDLARFAQDVVSTEERVVVLAPQKEPQTPLEWIQQNLFSGWFNSIVTILSSLFVVFAVYQIFSFVFVSGDWEIVRAFFGSYMVGAFPKEELWRVWVSLYAIATLAGLSYGISRHRPAISPRRVVTGSVIAAAATGFFGFAVKTALVRLLIVGVVAAVGLGIAAGHILGQRLRRPLLFAWLGLFPAIIFVLRGFDGVPPKLWEGFLFNILAATVGIFASFPIGIALAIGRRSSLPAVRTVCVLFIEIFRGVPLVAWLIFSKFVFDLLLPPNLDAPPDIVKSLIAMTLFSSAYVAEIVRGGLQSVNFGQFEAARALGLSTTRMMAFVVLPQALRATIPAMISHFISLFKDTALFSAIEVNELLDIARRTANNPEFFSRFGFLDMETLLFAGFVFWIVAFSMSRWSQRLEVRLGVGER